MTPVKVLGKIELPVDTPTLYHCVKCGKYKPATDFPYGHTMSLYDCYDCEFEDMPWVDPPQPRRGNIEGNFLEDWIRDMEDQLDNL